MVFQLPTSADQIHLCALQLSWILLMWQFSLFMKRARTQMCPQENDFPNVTQTSNFGRKKHPPNDAKITHGEKRRVSHVMIYPYKKNGLPYSNEKNYCSETIRGNKIGSVGLYLFLLLNFPFYVTNVNIHHLQSPQSDYHDWIGLTQKCPRKTNLKGILVQPCVCREVFIPSIKFVIIWCKCNTNWAWFPAILLKTIHLRLNSAFSSNNFGAHAWFSQWISDN